MKKEAMTTKLKRIYDGVRDARQNAARRLEENGITPPTSSYLRGLRDALDFVLGALISAFGLKVEEGK